MDEQEKKRKKKATRLNNLEIDEISLVDSPAVGDATFVLVKRERPELFAKILSFDGGPPLSLYEYASALEGEPLDAAEFVKLVDTPLEYEDDLSPLDDADQKRAVEMLDTVVNNAGRCFRQLRREARMLNRRIDQSASRLKN